MAYPINTRKYAMLSFDTEEFDVPKEHGVEFYPLGNHPEWKLPFIIRNHSGEDMYLRLKTVIENLQQQGCEFITYCEFAQINRNKKEKK